MFLGMITIMPLAVITLQENPSVAYAQETIIPVNQTTPCFLNYTAGIQMMRNCGFGDDYLEAIVAPFEWITGGWFSMILVSLFVIISYVKYHKAVYPILIGIFFLPISYFAFPEEFLTFAILVAGMTFGILVWYIYIKQTKEY